jgi:hypothetical protein
MDLWDVIKIMGRRWYVALPMLLIAAVGGAWTVAKTEPDYVATTSMILLPPVQRADSPARSPIINPWDPYSLTIATVSYLNTKVLHDRLGAEGLSDVWTANVDTRSGSIIIIEVTAPSGQLALDTADALRSEIVRDVARRQSGYDLKPGEEITTVSLDDASNLETATTKLKRVLIVVAGVGILLTIGMTIGTDALLRRRDRRRRGGIEGNYELEIAPAWPTGPRSGSVVTRPFSAEPDGRQIALPSLASPIAQDSPPWLAPAIIKHRTAPSPSNEPTAWIAGADPTRDSDDEPSATIVLPLSMTKPPDRRSENGKR